MKNSTPESPLLLSSQSSTSPRWYSVSGLSLWLSFTSLWILHKWNQSWNFWFASLRILSVRLIHVIAHNTMTLHNMVPNFSLFYFSDFIFYTFSFIYSAPAQARQSSASRFSHLLVSAWNALFSHLCQALTNSHLIL